MYFHNCIFVIITSYQEQFDILTNIKTNKQLETIVKQLNTFKSKSFKTEVKGVFLSFQSNFFLYFHKGNLVFDYIYIYVNMHMFCIGRNLCTSSRVCSISRHLKMSFHCAFKSVVVSSFMWNGSCWC